MFYVLCGINKLSHSAEFTMPAELYANGVSRVHTVQLKQKMYEVRNLNLSLI
jgi:hypothetical protein